MIGKLRGKVELVEEDHVLIDVNGIGYTVFTSSKALNVLHEKLGKEVSLIIETVVREEYIHLYGFIDKSEKICFNELCRVNGVGNKVALKILGTLSINDVVLAISSQDKTIFSSISGIGPKLAVRIISELKDRVNKISGSAFAVNDNSENNSAIKVGAEGSILLNDAVSALENLGYKRSEIYKIVSAEINNQPQTTLETLITNSLRKISAK